MMHYIVQIKQEAVRLVLEKHMTFAPVITRLEICKAEWIEACVGMYRRKGKLSFHGSWATGEDRELRVGSETVLNGREARPPRNSIRIPEMTDQAGQYLALYHHKSEYNTIRPHEALQGLPVRQFTIQNA